jgi:uncharacterized membrane protein YjfL (UPF0719 family)
VAASTLSESGDVATTAAAAGGPVVQSSASQLPAYVLWGASGLTLAVGAYFGVSALNAKHDFDEHPSFSGADRAEGRAMVADVAIGMGISLAVIGTFFYFTDGTADADHAQAGRAQRVVTFAPILHTRVRGATASVRF